MTTNKHLLEDLTRLGLWDSELKNEIIAHNGSVQELDIPDNLKALYKTVWELKQRVLVDMAAGEPACRACPGCCPALSCPAAVLAALAVGDQSLPDSTARTPCTASAVPQTAAPSSTSRSRSTCT